MRARIVHIEGIKRFGFEPSCLNYFDVAEDNTAKIRMLKKVIYEIMENELTEIQREIVLEHMNGKSLRDIAAERGIHESTVSRHHTKAMKTLTRIGAYIAPFLR